MSLFIIFKYGNRVKPGIHTNKSDLVFYMLDKDGVLPLCTISAVISSACFPQGVNQNHAIANKYTRGFRVYCTLLYESSSISSDKVCGPQYCGFNLVVISDTLAAPNNFFL